MITLRVPDTGDHDGDGPPPDAWFPPEPTAADRIEHAAQLLEQAQQFLAGASGQVRRELGAFFAAQGLHPVGASGVFLDDFCFTAHHIRQNLKEHTA